MSAGKRLPGTPEPMHHWEGVGGVTIVGDSWGDPDGPLVILQHGGGQTRHAWKGAGETLGAAGYHAVAFDARGHGDSDWAPDGVYGQDIMVADLVKVVDALGNRRPVLVGASMGGGTSLVAIGEDHVDATALVLVDIAPRIEPEGAQKIQAFMGQRPEGFDSLDEVAEAIASYQPHRQRPRNLDGLAKNVRLGDDGRYHWHWDPKFRTGHRDLEASARAPRGLRPQPHRCPRCWCAAACPTCSARRAPRASWSCAPHSEFVNVTGAAHMVAGDRNDIFANAVIEFLARTVPVDGSPVQPPHEPHPHHEGPPGRHPGRPLTGYTAGRAPLTREPGRRVSPLLVASARPCASAGAPCWSPRLRPPSERAVSRWRGRRWRRARGAARCPSSAARAAPSRRTAGCSPRRRRRACRRS